MAFGCGKGFVFLPSDPLTPLLWCGELASLLLYSIQEGMGTTLGAIHSF